MLFFLHINVKMTTIVGILTFMRRKKFHFSADSVEHGFFNNLGASLGLENKHDLGAQLINSGHNYLVSINQLFLDTCNDIGYWQIEEKLRLGVDFDLR